MADDLKLYLSQLDIDGQLYELKDAEARASLAELNQTIIDNEQVTAAALNDLESRKAEKTDIPTKVSDLTNDVPFATRAQLDALSDTLSGMDSDFLAELQKIVAELEGTDSAAANAWTTLVDRLKGLGTNAAVYYTQEEADAYNTEHSLNDGDEGYKTTNDVKTPESPVTVKQYVDAAIASIPPTDLTAIESAIQALQTNKVNKADIEEVAISQDTFTVVNEKLMVSTSTLNVLRNKVVTP